MKNRTNGRNLMQPLIKIDNRDGRQTVNARELHAFLEVGKVFAAWIQERIEQYGFVENQDFIIFSDSGKNSSGIKVGRPSKEYHISIDMAKELAMVERNEKGKQARQYFIECERIAKDPMALLADPKRLLQLTEHYAKRTIELENQIAEQKPKVEGYERLTFCEGALNLTNTAKALDIPPQRFFRQLQEHRWIFRRVGGGSYVAYQDKIQRGYLTHKIYRQESSDGTEKVREQVLVTPKGLRRLHELFPRQEAMQ